MNTTPHKASAEQWARQEEFAAGSDMLCCLLELRARVDALEEAENDRRFERAKAIIDQPAPTPASSLAEQVAAKQESVPAFGAYSKTNDQEVIYPLERKDEKYHLSAVSAPASSLVERVAGAIKNVGWDTDSYDPEARAAIRAVAAWLRDNPGPNSAWGAVARDLMDEASRG